MHNTKTEAMNFGVLTRLKKASGEITKKRREKVVVDPVFKLLQIRDTFKFPHIVVLDTVRRLWRIKTNS